MPVTMARLPGFQSAKSARWYQALTGPTQATGSAGGYDLTYGILISGDKVLISIFYTPPVGEIPRFFNLVFT